MKEYIESKVNSIFSICSVKAKLIKDAGNEPVIFIQRDKKAHQLILVMEFNKSDKISSIWDTFELFREDQIKDIPEYLSERMKLEDRVTWNIFTLSDDITIIHHYKNTPTNEFSILEENGWVVECESPFEIRKDDVSFATGEAAHIILYYLKEENKKED